MDDAGPDALREAIRDMHGCHSRWVESVAVREASRSRLWEGEVQVFELTGHPVAKRCYAWSYPVGSTTRRIVALLHSPHVDSPAAAVRAFLEADGRTMKN